MKRYTVSLRDAHPQERAVAECISALPPRRRQERIRELLRIGLGSVPPRPVYRSSTHETTATRYDVYLNEDYATDVPIVEALESIAPRLRHDYLRSLLVGGLLGDGMDAQEKPFVPESQTPAQPAVKAAPTPKATTTTNETKTTPTKPEPVPIAPDVDFVLPDAIENEKPSAVVFGLNDDGDGAGKKRSELRGLWM